MHDKSTVSQPPAAGTCCGRAETTTEAIQPREYIYNLLAHPTSPLNPHKCLPKIRQRRRARTPPPLPDAVPKAAHKTMGPPYQPPCTNGSSFKTKNWRNPYVDQKCVRKQVKLAREAFDKLKIEHPSGRVKDACCAGVRPPIPPAQKWKQAPQCIEAEHRTNWIERNAIAAITQKPGNRVADAGKKMIVDTPRGDKQALVSAKTHSGLEKCFVYKPSYGKPPGYIRQRAEDVAATRREYAHYLNEKALQQTDQMLTAEERAELLKGLKSAWDAYNAKYHGLSASRSSEQQASYGNFLEKQLAALEKDIEVLETHPYIFVSGDKSPGVGGAVTADTGFL